MAMALYHNAANVDSQLPLTAGMGFDLGPGWTTSYSSLLILDDPLEPTTVTVIADDGTQDVYTWSGGQWVRPLGVHDELTAEPDSRIGPTWTLKHKDQSYHEYSGDGTDIARLQKIVDSTGNELTVHYDIYPNWRINKVVDSSGRELTFEYDASGFLENIRDPNGFNENEGTNPEPPGCTLPDFRDWTFAYDAEDRLEMLTDPEPYDVGVMGYETVIGYDVDGRISSISDKKEHGDNDPDVYQYDYNTAGRLVLVTDPHGPGQEPGLTQHLLLQSFEYSYGGGGFTRAYYTDRRGNEWFYQYFGTEDDSVYFPDGNLTFFSNPSPEYEWLMYEYDADRNLSAIEDVFSNRWELAYDAYGNLETHTDPLQHMQEWQYDEYNNVTSYTDAIGNTVEFRYDHASGQDAECSTTQDPCGTCLGGSTPGAECSADRDCGTGTCELDDSVCKICEISLGPCETDDDCDDLGPCIGTCEIVEAPLFPTLLTRVVEPPAQQGGDPGITTLDYYLDSSDDGRGRVKQAIDPNGAWAGFGYDQWGQISQYGEGLWQGGGGGGGGASAGSCETGGGGYVNCITDDSGGREIHSELAGGCPAGEASYTHNDWVFGIDCLGCPVAGGGGGAAGAPSTPPGPTLPSYWGNWSVAQGGYSPKGELLHATVNGELKIGDTVVDTYTRVHDAEYDELGRLITSSINAPDEWDDVRGFTYDYDWS
ncbi:MAG: RHS repeat protein, partial [Phycisphaerales bacterium]